MYVITKAWTFSAAHHLPWLDEGHKCRNVHGHNYRVTLAVGANLLDEMGMVTDYANLAPFGDFIRARLDHRDLNDGVTAIQPTAEALARYLYEAAVTLLPDVHIESVTVNETDNTSAEYRP